MEILFLIKSSFQTLKRMIEPLFMSLMLTPYILVAKVPILSKNILTKMLTNYAAMYDIYYEGVNCHKYYLAMKATLVYPIGVFRNIFKLFFLKY